MFESLAAQEVPGFGLVCGNVCRGGVAGCDCLAFLDMPAVRLFNGTANLQGVIFFGIGGAQGHTTRNDTGTMQAHSPRTGQDQ